MATVAQQLAEDFDALIADFSVTFTFSGSTYAGTISEVTKGRTLEEGGMFPDLDAIITLKGSDFSTKPKAGDKITVTSCFDSSLNGLVFRIQTVEYPDGITIRLAVISLTQ